MVRHNVYSDPTAKAQSEGGHGPVNCGPPVAGPLVPLFAIRDAAQGLIDNSQNALAHLNRETLHFLADPAAYTTEKIRQGQAWGWQRWDAARATPRAEPRDEAWQNFRQDPRGFAQEVVRQGQRAWQ